MIERLFPAEAAAWLPDGPKARDIGIDLVWWLSHCEPLVLMASRTHWTRAWHSYVVLPREEPA